MTPLKPDKDTARKLEIAYDILSYLTEHPDAQDTIEGIIEWWLLEQKIKRETDNVKEALAQLVADGFVLECKYGGSRSYYKINIDKYREIQVLLRKKSE